MQCPDLSLDFGMWHFAEVDVLEEVEVLAVCVYAVSG